MEVAGKEYCLFYLASQETSYLHTSLIQLRDLFLAVPPKAEEYSTVNHRGAKIRILGEHNRQHNHSCAELAGGMDAWPQEREAQLIHTCNGQMYPDTLSWVLGICACMGWGRHRKGQWRMSLDRLLMRMCEQGVYAIGFLRYMVTHATL